MQLKNSTDVWSGVLFSVAGICFAVGATNYSFGNSARPGPAYFPFGLGVLLAVLGLVILAKALAARTREEPVEGRIAWRPLLVVIAAILAFGIALPRLGMVIALPMLITIISTAGDQFRWRDVIVNCVVLTVGSWAVFIKGLQLTIPVWPPFVS